MSLLDLPDHVVSFVVEYLPVGYLLSVLSIVSKQLREQVIQYLKVEKLKNIETALGMQLFYTKQQNLVYPDPDMIVLELKKDMQLEIFGTIMEKLVGENFPFPFSLVLKDVDILQQDYTHSFWQKLQHHFFHEIVFTIRSNVQYIMIINYLAKQEFSKDFPFVSFDFDINIEQELTKELERSLSQKYSKQVSEEILELPNVKKLKQTYFRLWTVDNCYPLLKPFCKIEELILTTNNYNFQLSYIEIPSTVRKITVNCIDSSIDDEDIIKFLAKCGADFQSLELNGYFEKITGSFIQHLPQSTQSVKLIRAKTLSDVPMVPVLELKSFHYEAQFVSTSENALRNYFPNAFLRINQTQVLQEEKIFKPTARGWKILLDPNPTDPLPTADELSIRNWKLYSTLPLDFVNTPFLHEGEAITVCFQPFEGERNMLQQVSDKKWIYTSYNNTPLPSKTSINNANQNKENSTGSSGTSNANMDLTTDFSNHNEVEGGDGKSWIPIPRGSSGSKIPIKT